MNTKLSIGNKLGIFLALAILVVGVFLSRYIPAKIFAESATLIHTGVTLEMSLICILYNSLSLVVLVFFAIIGLVCIKRKNSAIIVAIHCLVVAIALFAFIYLPKTTEPWYRYQFLGFVEGIQENIDEQNFKQWLEKNAININAGDGRMFDREELAFLSKNGKFGCETHVEKDENGTYEVTMYWGSPIGHYGLFVSDNPERVGYMKKENDVVEVYDNIWAWIEN